MIILYIISLQKMQAAQSQKILCVLESLKQLQTYKRRPDLLTEYEK